MNDLYGFGVLKCNMRPVFPREVHSLRLSDTRFPDKKYVATVTEIEEGEYTWEARNKEGRLMWHGSGTNLERVKMAVDNRSRVYFGRLDMARQLEEARAKNRPDVKTDAGLADIKALAVDVRNRTNSYAVPEARLTGSVHDLINEVRELRRKLRNNAHDQKVQVQRVAKMMFLNKDKENTEADWNCLTSAVHEKWNEAASEFLGVKYAPVADVKDRFLP